MLMTAALSVNQKRKIIEEQFKLVWLCFMASISTVMSYLKKNHII